MHLHQDFMNPVEDALDTVYYLNQSLSLLRHNFGKFQDTHVGGGSRVLSLLKVSSLSPLIWTLPSVSVFSVLASTPTLRRLDMATSRNIPRMSLRCHRMVLLYPQSSPCVAASLLYCQRSEKRSVEVEAERGGRRG
jgi:hypothetical protein